MGDGPRRHSGFTLIELSIVLVIIGLIVGGVLVGRDLIQAAAARSVISDIERFKTATNTFLGKYNCLPGDCSNATSFFGASVNCSGGSAALAGGTCNGNGNGNIATEAELSFPAPAPGFDTYHAEDMLFWQQLSMAGLVPGSYSGGNYNFTATSANVPFSNGFSGACYSVGYTEDNQVGGPSGLLFNHAASNVFLFGSAINPDAAAYSTGCEYSAVTPLVARNIDSKIDDGNPATGNVTTYAYAFVASGSAWNACVSAGGPPFSYVLATTTPVCQLIFQAGF